MKHVNTICSSNIPCFFPYGDDDFHVNIPLQSKNHNQQVPTDIDKHPDETQHRTIVTMREYYAYKLMIHPNEGTTFCLSIYSIFLSLPYVNNNCVILYNNIQNELAAWRTFEAAICGRRLCCRRAIQAGLDQIPPEYNTFRSLLINT